MNSFADYLVRRDIGVADGGGPAEKVDGLVAGALALQLPVPQRQLVVLAAAEPSEPPSGRYLNEFRNGLPKKYIKLGRLREPHSDTRSMMSMGHPL